MEAGNDILRKDLDSFVAALKQTPNDYTTIAECLRYIRQNKLRKSDLVVKFGNKLLEEKANSLSEIEEWDVQEQVFCAALDTNNLKLALNSLNKIKRQFGDKGIRVRRLIGLLREAQGKWKEAEAVYQSILEDDPVNSAAMKRQIAIRKALGDNTLAIKLLNEYLKIFMSDTDAWQELAELYLEQQMYKFAALCYEELLLATPGNYHLHSKYAEIVYTLGGYDNLRLSRKYFAHSLEMNDTNNVRALYGLLMTCIAISSTKQGRQDVDRNQDPENVLLFDFAYQKLVSKYKDSAKDKLKLLSALGKNKGKEEE